MNKTVLVIEDNPANLKLAAGLLGLLGCRVLEAGDAETGLDLLRENEVNLVLLDIHLPGMDGLSACRVIRNEMGMADLPVLALSALAMETDVENALEAGCDGYITKPINTKSFLELISGWLSGERRGMFQSRDHAGVQSNLKKVLVVDDNKTNVKVIKSMLPPDQYEVLEAYNGQDALETASRSLPDVVFLDIMMPEMDGYEVTRRLKASPDTAHIPIVLVTALEGMERRVQGLEMGAEDVLVKPVNRVEILARARSMVRLSEYQKQLTIREQVAAGFTLPEQTLWPLQVRRTPSILLVEDNRADEDLYVDHMSQEDWEVIVARNGSDAQRLLSGTEFDLVLLDLVLPDMDGLELLRKIKKVEGSGIPQVAIITALDDLETRLKGIEGGADDYLVKPVHPKEFMARIRVLLRKKGYIDRLMMEYRSALNSAVKDDLTGVFNKAYFHRYLDLEVKRAARHRYPVSLIMADIDDFKDYNTRFGHLVGDLVIREVAAVLRAAVREVDLVARFGGDEFALVLPFCGAGESDRIVQRVREAVKEHSFPEEESLAPGSVSVSTGLATFPDDTDTAEDIIRMADKDLMAAKARRRRSRDRRGEGSES